MNTASVIIHPFAINFLLSSLAVISSLVDYIIYVILRVIKGYKDILSAFEKTVALEEEIFSPE